MGLIIKSTPLSKITLIGAPIELDEVYGRIEFVGRTDGKSLSISIQYFYDKESYDENKLPMVLNLPINSFIENLDLNEAQDISSAHKYAKLFLEELGYEIEINL